MFIDAETCKIIGLFCKRSLQKRRYSAKETYDFKEPTNQIVMFIDAYILQTVMFIDTISRLLKIVGLFCRISSLLQGSFAYILQTVMLIDAYILGCMVQLDVLVLVCRNAGAHFKVKSRALLRKNRSEEKSGARLRKYRALLCSRCTSC